MWLVWGCESGMDAAPTSTAVAPVGAQPGHCSAAASRGRMNQVRLRLRFSEALGRGRG